jgi:sugar lactone lactonase YvrE
MADAFNRHASAPATIGEEGIGTAQFSNPDGVAVEQGTGDVYVVDTGNNRVEKFDADGSFLLAFGANVGGLGTNVCTLVCEPGTAGSGTGQLDAPTWVAVDDSGLSPGGIYVADAGNDRVEQFKPNGEYVSSITSAPLALGDASEPFTRIGGLSVDPSGDVWIGQPTPTAEEAIDVANPGGRVDEFRPDGAFVASVQLPGQNGEDGWTGLAVNSQGDFYGFQEKAGQQNGRLGEFDSTGTFSYGFIDDSTDNDTGVTIDPGSSALGGKDSVYVAGYAYTSEGSNSLGPSVSQYSASPCADILESEETTGHCARLETFGSGSLGRTGGVGVDAASGTVYVVDRELDDLAIFPATVLPDVVTGEASTVAGTSATLHGTVAPDGTSVTSCEFEYVSDAAYRAAIESGATNPYEGGGSVSCSPTPVGGGTVAVSGAIAGLEPEIRYHYRLVAANAGGSQDGSDQVLVPSVAPIVSAEAVIDVAPVTSSTSVRATVSAEIDAAGAPTTYRVEYGVNSVEESSTPERSVGAGVGSVGVTAQLEGLRPASSYRFRFVATNEFDGGSPTLGSEETFVTAPVSSGAVDLPDDRAYELVSVEPRNVGDVFLPKGTSEGEGVPFGAGWPERAAADGDALTYVGAPTAEAGNGADSNGFGIQYLAKRSTDEGWTAANISPSGSSFNSGYLTFSSDFSKGIAYAEAPSPALVPEGPRVGLYAHAFGEEAFRLLPYRSFFSSSTVATSADLGHVLLAEAEGQENLEDYEWSSGRASLVNVLPGGATSPDPTFHFISADGSLVVWGSEDGSLYARERPESAEAKTVLIAEGGEYRAASADGSTVFFTKGGDLYSFDVHSAAVTDLAPGGEVQSVVGASEDGTYVYFTATGDLATGATAGESNLYLSHGGTVSFIATNASGMEVAPDGQHLLIQAQASDAVYVYSASGNGLECASCNDRGEPIAVTLGNENRSGETGQHNFVPYQPRWMSADGSRVFFEAGALVPQATASSSVYEWERDGTGSCDSGGGCVYVVSGGSKQAWFVDASASGDDVFFITRAQLTAQDKNEYADLYDARVDGNRPISPSVCTGTGCQGIPPAPPIFSTPASVTFSGIGNFPPAPTASKPKPQALKCKRGLVKKKGRCVRKKRKLGKVSAVRKASKSTKGRK